MHHVPRSSSTRYGRCMLPPRDRYPCILVVGASLQIGFQKGLFKLPMDVDTPLICIGPGTGIAPMRAVIEDRINQGATRKYFSTK